MVHCLKDMFKFKRKRQAKRNSSLGGQPDHLSGHEYVFVIVIGLCMAYVAGYSNGVSLSGFLHVNDPIVEAPVAGVTNLITSSAIALAEGDIVTYKFHIGILFCVMAGSCLSGVMNPRSVAFVLTPRYGPTFIIGSAFSALGAVAAIQNRRREFYFTAIGNGIMNGVTSMYSANLIRVSSFSGPVTDIGIYIGQWLRGNRSNNWRLYILSGLAFAFWIGGLSGYEAARFKRQNALIFNATFFFAIGCAVVLYFVIAKKLTIWEAMFGIGKVGIRFKHITVKKKRADSQGNDVNVSVGKDELLELYDEILEREGKVDQDALMDLLASRDLEVKRHRRSLLGIIQEKFKDGHDQDGDWKISREDWERLVKKTSQSLLVDTSAMGKRTEECGGARASIAALQRASVIQIESTGYAQILEEDEEKEEE